MFTWFNRTRQVSQFLQENHVIVRFITISCWLATKKKRHVLIQQVSTNGMSLLSVNKNCALFTRVNMSLQQSKQMYDGSLNSCSSRMKLRYPTFFKQTNSLTRQVNLCDKARTKTFPFKFPRIQAYSCYRPSIRSYIADSEDRVKARQYAPCKRNLHTII